MRQHIDLILWVGCDRWFGKETIDTLLSSLRRIWDECIEISLVPKFYTSWNSIDMCITCSITLELLVIGFPYSVDV